MTEDVELYEEGLYIWLDTDARGAEVMQVIRESGKLGKETEEKGIFDYLKGLFTGDIKRIQRYSHIEWSEPFQEEASKMTGFGDMIYERGIQQGMQQGMQQGIQQGRHEGMILGALMSGKTPEEVSKMLNLPLEEIKKVQEQQMTVNK